MRTWVRAPWPMLCGACGREIAKGAPMLEITFHAQQPQREPLERASRPTTWTQTKARCETCAEGSPPDLAPLLERAVSVISPSPKPMRQSTGRPFARVGDLARDWKQIQSGGDH